MPNRYIREGIITSEAVNSLDAGAEVFYRRLLNRCDDHGLFDARPAVLRASLYPLQLEKVREANVSRWLTDCEQAGLVRLYVISDRPYGKVLKTLWPVRSAPKFPPPADGCEQLRATENNCATNTSTGTSSSTGAGTDDATPKTGRKKTWER